MYGMVLSLSEMVSDTDFIRMSYHNPLQSLGTYHEAQPDDFSSPSLLHVQSSHSKLA